MLDPHSAVGFLGLETALHERQDAIGILTATAHPCKFADIVEPVIGQAIELPAWYSTPKAAGSNVTQISGSTDELLPILE